MIVIWGFYRFSRKIVGYRNDFCLMCNANQCAEWVKSFHMGHLYWIPLLPLGNRHEWFCSVCGSDPHARVESSKGFKRFVAGFFLLLAVFVLVMAVIATLGTMSDIAKRSDAPVVWGIFLGASAVAAGALYWATRTGDPVDLDHHLRLVPSLSSELCRYCQGALDSEGYCSGCQVTHYPLEFT